MKTIIKGVEADKILEEMEYLTSIVECEVCKFSREENEKTHWLFVCSYDSEKEIEVNPSGRCSNFKRR